MTETTSRTISDQLDHFLKSLERHPVFDNNYFKLLKSERWCPKTYDLYRANFFYRTELTVKGIAHVCARSAAENDMDTLILFSYILGEETGCGDKSRCHEIFMETALNLYGETEYQLVPLKVQEAKNSNLIISETKNYRHCIQQLITESYQRMLGVTMALETHADIMLSAFREAFRINKFELSNNDFSSKVEVYFNSHIENGVEERHAEDAKQCVMNNCHTSQDLEEIKVGALGAMTAQLNMWDAMYRKHLEIAGQ